MKFRLKQNLVALVGATVLFLSSAMAVAAPASWTLCDGTILQNLAQAPALESVKAGNWNDPAIWNNKRVPQPDDNILIRHKVTLGESAAACNILVTDPGAELALDPGKPLDFKFKTILVTERGRLSATPMKGVTQRLIVRDLPLDAADSTQLGNGIVVFGYGQLVLQGQMKTAHEQLVGGAPQASTGLLIRNPVTGWNTGDRVYIADTREIPVYQRRPFASRHEIMTLESDAGQTATIQPLLFDHAAAYDSKGALRVTPSVANITRNLIVASENPLGVRGHVICTEHALAVVEYTEFVDMGRTLMGAINAANPKGRYPLHAHHLMGSCGCRGCDRAAGPYLKDGEQFRFAGNVIHEGRKWGLVVHASSYGTISDNIIFNVQGAGLVLESGSEVGNVVKHNFVSRIKGSGGTYSIGNKADDGSIYTWGTAGHGIVLRNMLNDVTLNRVEGLEMLSVGSSAINIFPRETNNPLLCAVPGEMATVAVDVRRCGNQFNGKTYKFDSNVIFGANAHGLQMWDIGGGGRRRLLGGDIPVTRITNLTVAHTVGKAITFYEIRNVYVQGAVFGNPKGLYNERGTGVYSEDAPTDGLVFELLIDTKTTAIVVPPWAKNVQFLNCKLSNNLLDIDVKIPDNVQTPAAVPQLVRFDNCFFSVHKGTRLRYQFWGPSSKPPVSMLVPSQFIFTSMNGDPDANYEWFRKEQAPEAVIMMTLAPEVAATIPDGLPTNHWADANRAFGYKPALDRVATGTTTLPGFPGFMVKTVDPSLASFD